MFKAVFLVIGLVFIAIKVAVGDFSLFGAVYKLWFIIIVFGLLGRLFDMAFLVFYEDAVKKLSSNGK